MNLAGEKWTASRQGDYVVFVHNSGDVQLRVRVAYARWDEEKEELAYIPCFEVETTGFLAFDPRVDEVHRDWCILVGKVAQLG